MLTGTRSQLLMSVMYIYVTWRAFIFMHFPSDRHFTEIKSKIHRPPLLYPWLRSLPGCRLESCVGVVAWDSQERNMTLKSNYKNSHQVGSESYWARIYWKAEESQSLEILLSPLEPGQQETNAGEMVWGHFTTCVLGKHWGWEQASAQGCFNQAVQSLILLLLLLWSKS